jgi:5-formyltetrahydrofolate cyclo-ligase
VRNSGVDTVHAPSGTPDTRTPSPRAQLRKHCLQARKTLSVAERREASHAICRRLHRSPHYWGARHIAFYWPMAVEVDLRELLGAALREGKRCYLPVLRPGRRLWFVRYREGDVLRPSHYGIPEPRFRQRDALAPSLLDLVCMPLAGFDRSGTRLGMGGGYYDRSFSFLRSGRGKPRLVGVAFSCQETAHIEREPWDVPLAGVITERAEIRCAPAPA